MLLGNILRLSLIHRELLHSSQTLLNRGVGTLIDIRSHSSLHTPLIEERMHQLLVIARLKTHATARLI